MNISRRAFLLGSLGLTQALPFQQCFGRSKAVKTGVYALSRQDWPPAIVPDHVAFIDKGLSCFADQFGRVAIVDFKKTVNPKVMGELHIPVKRVVDFATVRQRAYALTIQESATGDTQYCLTTISLAPASEPTVVAQTALNQFTEATSISAYGELICIGGLTGRGDHQVAVFSTRGKSVEPAFISSCTVQAPIVKLDLQDRQLVVLESTGSSQIDYVSLFYPLNPQLRKTIKLDGDYHVMARSKDILVLAGQSASTNELECKTIALESAPHVMQSQRIDNLTNILSASAHKDRFYLLGEDGGERKIVELWMRKDLQLTQEQAVSLPGGKVAPGIVSAIAAQDRTINVASGWQGVDILALTQGHWAHTLNYSIPRFPASGVALWGDLVVLAGADYKLYNIARPDRPLLSQTVDCGETVKAVATAGVFLLSLSKSALALRRMDNLSNIIASTDLTGQDMSLDKKKQTVYVLRSQDKKTTITPVKAYSNKLIADKEFELATSFRRIVAHNGKLLLSGLKDLALYEVGGSLQQISKHTLDGFAIRDIALTDELIVVTAVDHSSKGFLFVLSGEANDMARVGTTDLPQDGIALAVSGNKAIVVGRTPEGKDVATVIDLSTPAIPKALASLPSVEASSAVTIRDSLAIVVGRGLAIISLG